MKIIIKILVPGILKKCFLYLTLISALIGYVTEAESSSLAINLDPENISGRNPDYTASFKEGDLPVNITAPSAVIEDNEGMGINYLTITIKNPQPGDILTADTSGTNIIFQYNQNSLVLTGMNPGGMDSAEQYQKVLQTVRFNNPGTNPDTTMRIIEFTAFSGQNNDNTASNTAACFLTIISVNSPPVNTIPGSQMTPVNIVLIFSSNNGNRISVSDEEAEAGEIQVSLTIDRGSLILAGDSGSRITGNNTIAVVLTGAVEQVNSELDGLKYEPEPGWSGKVYLNIETSDLGYSGMPGPLTDNDIIEITVGVTTEPNQEPDAVFNEGETVILDAFDQTGEMKTYEWYQISGPGVFLSDKNIASPAFTAPIVSFQGAELIFELKSENNEGMKFTTRVIIKINDNGIIGFPEDVLTFRPAAQAEMGIKIIKGELISIKGINPDEIENTENRPENLIYGLINIQVKVLTPEDQGAVAEIYFSEPADNEYKWFGFHEDSGWSDYGENSVFSDDRRHVTLYLNDYMDNGIINNTSGLGKPSTGSGAGDSGGGCFIRISDLKNNLNPF
ncbi:Uncharacterized protein dnl_52740 [Desulfonema limicola]|uniref:Uncharacterized protein n=1 Tax=Desulfonema limicola TaxID=45656 RepID=A0A975GJC0_9BACT|nr:hypothetical protein [Desulfonema limicola]QTA82888.1 Uncharacterized protein dnl_52740 [Desulfonema limicola]